MGFHVIRGTFHVKGYSPDGDSVRFKAADNTKWALLAGPPVQLNGQGHAQLRLEAIDTLETHFQGEHQPLAFADQATIKLLTELGITGVVWNASHTKITAANDGTPGYIISRQVEQNRRPVAFAYAGVSPEADGASLFLTAARVLQSVNAEMLRTGLAYPTYYKGLFPDLRNALTGLAATARSTGLGLWPQDRTNSGCVITGLSSITDDNVILPKLFRRLVVYLETGGALAGFPAFVSTEEIFIISTAHSTHFDTIITVAGNTVTMTELPENVIFG
jgi:endonuclease YncB( thermonuclease family)